MTEQVSATAAVPHRRTVPWWLILGTGAISIAIVLGTFAVYGTGEEGLQLATRYTVRDSFPLFLLAYTASAWVTLTHAPASKWLLRNRRYIGLSFALAHTIHFAMIVSYFSLTPAELDFVTILFGGLAYLFIWVMAATSNDWSVRTLGRNWKRLHLVGSHYVWLIFVLTYGPRLVEPGMFWVGVVGLGLAFAVLGVRVAAGIKMRRMRRARTVC